MNKVFLIGRLTKDIELKQTQGGKAYCNFTIAINNGKDKDGNDIPADFPQISVFGKQAELCAKYLGKGLQVCVVGKVKTSTKQNQNGTTTFYTNIHAENIEFLEWKDNKQGQPAPAPQQQYQPQYQQGMPQQAPYQQPMQQYPQGMPPQYQQPMPNNGAPQGFVPADEDYGFDPSQL